jgi:hypothetical protein
MRFDSLEIYNPGNPSYPFRKDTQISYAEVLQARPMTKSPDYNPPMPIQRRKDEGGEGKAHFYIEDRLKSIEKAAKERALRALDDSEIVAYHNSLPIFAQDDF